MSDSAYLWSKPLKSEFYFSGLPEKACQGCHISKWVPRNFAICTSNWRILDPWLIAIVGFHGTKIWFVQNCAYSRCVAERATRGTFDLVGGNFFSEESCWVASILSEQIATALRYNRGSTLLMTVFPVPESLVSFPLPLSDRFSII